MVDGNQIEVKNEAKILGLKLKRTGFVSHIADRINLARTQTNKIRRFIHLNTKTKLHLYKALIRPLLEYPIIPMALASKAQMLNLQKIQNNNIRIITKFDPELEDKTIEERHNILKIEPINIRLYDRLTKLWNKVEEKEIETYNLTMNSNNDRRNDHAWWPRAGYKAVQDIPEPLYTSNA